MGMIASTSPQSTVPDNVRTGSYYYYLDRTGQPLPETPAEGYGNLAQRLHRQNVQNVQAGGMDPMQNPKPVSFTENLLGNEQPVTIDTHNFRLLGMASKDPRFLETSIKKPTGRTLPNGKDEYYTVRPRAMYDSGQLSMEDALKDPTLWASAPNPNEYRAYEAYQQKMANKMGMTPAEFQEKMWVGGGKTTGLGSPPETFLRTVAKRVAYTAAQLKVSPDEVLQKFVRGEIPLLSVLPAAATLGGSALIPRAPQPAAAEPEEQ